MRGRRNTQSLLKQLRRGLSPAGPRLLFAWQAQYTEAPERGGARIVAGWAAASLCVARSCGADCRRLGRGSPLRGRRSTQSLLKELGRGLSPAGPRLLSAWQAQYTAPSEGAAARIVAGWAAALLCVAGAVHRASRSGFSPAGPRLLSAWQAQYTEELRRGLSPATHAPEGVAGWAVASLCAAGAVAAARIVAG